MGGGALVGTAETGMVTLLVGLVGIEPATTAALLLLFVLRNADRERGDV